VADGDRAGVLDLLERASWATPGRRQGHAAAARRP
jgi:hypothetical protein